jgi:hypothetical protein
MQAPLGNLINSTLCARSDAAHAKPPYYVRCSVNDRALCVGCNQTRWLFTESAAPDPLVIHYVRSTTFVD